MAKKNWGVPRIVVDTMVKSDFAEIGKKVREMDDGSKCTGGMKYEEKSRVVGDNVGGKVKAIRVLRVAAWKADPKAGEAQAKVEKVWAGKFQSAFCQIAWAEPTLWSVEAELEFDDGKRGALITDGSHVALQDHDGNNRFLRIFPAAQ